jgi:hypothetical protein
VVNGGKDTVQSYSLLSVIDTDNASKIADLKIEGETLEAMALDIWRPRVYVNNRARNEVAVVDRWKQKVVASWPVVAAAAKWWCSTRIQATNYKRRLEMQFRLTF